MSGAKRPDIDYLIRRFRYYRLKGLDDKLKIQKLILMLHDVLRRGMT